jgi:NifU-like protein
MHCSVMGQEALEAAIYKYRGIEIEQHNDDDGALVCTCFGISEAKIRRVAIENDLTTAEQVTNYVKAGGGCGSCLVNIEDILATVQQDRAQVTTQVAAELATAQQGAPLTTLQKINRIQQVISSEIRPLLLADGGDVELYDVEGDRVQVILKGACSSCESSNETLKQAIEVRLREQVLSSLRVEAMP